MRFMQYESISKESVYAILDRIGSIGLTACSDAMIQDIALETDRSFLSTKENFIKTLPHFFHAELVRILPQEEVLLVSPKERLLEVFLTHFDLLRPVGGSLRRLTLDTLKTPPLYRHLYHLVEEQVDFIVTHAHISTEGVVGRVKRHSIKAIYIDTFRRVILQSMTEENLMQHLDRLLSWGEGQLQRYA